MAVDLFAGAGGMTLGFEQAGFDVLASVEYDPVHAAIHAYNFPRTETLCANVAHLSAEELRSAAALGHARHGNEAGSWDGSIDVLFGGPPCQGFSSIGRRLVDDHRNRLVFHFFRLVSELQPRYFVMENVPGMARGGHASILEQLVGEFRAAGYAFPEGPHRVLNAAQLGAPQDRKRLFLMGTRDGQPLATYPEPKVRPVAKRAGKGPTALDESDLPIGPSVMDAIGDVPNLDRFASLLKSDSARLSPAAQARRREAASPYAARLLGLEPDPSDLSYPRAWDPSTLTSSTRTVHGEKSISRFRNTKVGETEPVSRFYRLDPDGLSNTLRAGTGSEGGAFTSPRPIHPTLPRVISVREAARLHSFPDWFRLHETKWNGFRQIGNAVAPLVGRAVAEQVAEALGARPLRPTEVLALGAPDLLSMTMQEAAAHFGADPEAIPKGRSKDYTIIAEYLHAEGRPGPEGERLFTDDDIKAAFRKLKIRPPVDIGTVPKALALTGALVGLAGIDGRSWDVDVLAEGAYALRPEVRDIEATTVAPALVA